MSCYLASTLGLAPQSNTRPVWLRGDDTFCVSAAFSVLSRGAAAALQLVSDGVTKDGLVGGSG